MQFSQQFHSRVAETPQEQNSYGVSGRYSVVSVVKPLLKGLSRNTDRASNFDHFETSLFDEIICGCPSDLEHGSYIRTV
jgi:hypothetical protein